MKPATSSMTSKARPGQGSNAAISARPSQSGNAQGKPGTAIRGTGKIVGSIKSSIG